MIKAVLLDLDNTLIHNPDMAFARAFLDLFEHHFVTAGYTDASSKIRSAIRTMSNQQHGNMTNQQVAIDMLGGDSITTERVLASFYENEFPKLKPCVSAVEGAVDLIYRLREMGYTVVIATNPIYPETAIRQRMAWANLPLEDDLYALITSADTMHFAKPDPAYYAEILGRVGIEPDEAMMVGDSRRNDIKPAQTVGLLTYHHDGFNLGGIIPYLDNRSQANHALQLQPAMIEPQLRGNIGALHGFVDTVHDNFWHQRPDPNEWSIVQILCHLVESETETERARLQAILQEENPFITQPEQPGPDIEACAETGHQLAKDYMQVRQETIALIQSFTDDDWQRPARHSIFGLTTMLEMAYFTAQHDRLHLNQLCQTIGRCE